VCFNNLRLDFPYDTPPLLVEIMVSYALPCLVCLILCVRAISQRWSFNTDAAERPTFKQICQVRGFVCVTADHRTLQSHSDFAILNLLAAKLASLCATRVKKITRARAYLSLAQHD
jgi:hypothetical protein